MTEKFRTVAQRHPLSYVFIEKGGDVLYNDAPLNLLRTSSPGGKNLNVEMCRIATSHLSIEISNMVGDRSATGGNFKD
jgi:hypothetical protein